MRVVAGKYRGKNLASPKNDDVRPTTTRIKETMFNVLQGYVSDSDVLDLFAGSGALGIEAISRGARHVDFVDRSKDSIALVHQNLKGIDGDYTMQNVDFMSALRSAYVSGTKYDLIFIDPPYATALGELALQTIFDFDLLKKDGIAVFEHGSEKKYELTDNRYKMRTKVMGTITAEFVSHKSVAMMAGSYDPFTRGHEAVLDEALRRFDEVVVACLVNPDKNYTYSDAQRLAICEEVCKSKKGARALYSTRDAVDVAKEVGAEVLVRGIRGDGDKAYEQAMADYNREHGFDTLFIEVDGFKEVSSTLVREEILRGDFKNLPISAIALVNSPEFKNLK
ncbi:MAG: 16S rRNA (guanine(966)-N(2))-methyltransferase RsmD [Clostridia bacterium]|nr:16S rRNA (guanine(966)-N(2))-methyltransferase RsmD [Clostridia bacterium]